MENIQFEKDINEHHQTCRKELEKAKTNSQMLTEKVDEIIKLKKRLGVLMKQNENIPPEERAKEELFRKVRDILKKITTENFDTLADQIMQLQIDTKDKATGVMILVFENAINEQNFSESYAKLYKRLARAGKDGENAAAAAAPKATNLAAFKNTLLDKTERELAILEEGERKIFRRSGGTVCLNCGLFKVSLLTENIKKNDSSSEDKLENLCKLFTTVVKKFESTQKEETTICYSLDKMYTKMKNISDRRCRLMLQDVIKLRKNESVSTETDVNPKTMDQIQKEVKTEQMNNKFANCSLMSKKDDRRYGGGGSGGMGGSGGGFGDGSGGVNSGGDNSGGGGSGYYKSNRQQQAGGDETCGMSKFQWNHTSSNSNIGPTTTTPNLFAALYGLDSNKNSSGAGGGPRNKGSYNKGSMERERYGSAHGSRENSTSRSASARGSGPNDRDKDRERDSGRGSMQRGVPPSHHSYTGSSNSSSSTVPSRSNRSPAASQVSPPLSTSSQSFEMPRQPPQEIFEKPDNDEALKINSFVSKMITIAFEETFDAAEQIIIKSSEKYRWHYIFSILYEYLHSSKVKAFQRKIASDYVLFILKRNVITIEHFRYAYKEFCELADDIVIEVPALWK